MTAAAQRAQARLAAHAEARPLRQRLQAARGRYAACVRAVEEPAQSAAGRRMADRRLAQAGQEVAALKAAWSEVARRAALGVAS